jgi:hypothetical protein
MNTSATVFPKNERFINLVGDLQTDIKNLIKKEIDLAKAEMSEKCKVMGRNAAFLGAGAVCAVMAVFILFLGLGAMFAMLLQRADLSPGMAYFLSYVGLGLLLGGGGWFLIQKALHAFSGMSLTPEKALEPIKGQRTEWESNVRKIEVEQPKQSSDDLKAEVDITRERMEAELQELRQRLTPKYMLCSSFAGMKHHPLRAAIIGASTGLGGYLLWRRNHHTPTRIQPAHRFAPASWMRQLMAMRMQQRKRVFGALLSPR